MSSAKRSRGKSHYAQKGPPHRYSPEYQEWRDAAVRGDARGMAEADRRWHRNLPRITARLAHRLRFGREAAE